MNLPKFTAEISLGRSKRVYHGTYMYDGLSQVQSLLAGSVLPSQIEDMEAGGGFEGAELDETGIMEEAEEMEGEEMEEMEGEEMEEMEGEEMEGMEG
jgi:hypothetical protein